MTIRINRAHGLDRDAAKTRVNGVADSLAKKLSAKCHWEGDALVFKRSGANGRIQVDDQNIDIQVELGMLLRPLEDGIRKNIEEQLNQALA